MSDYYVYALLDPRKPEVQNYCRIEFSHVPKYVGKGRGGRAHASAFQEANYTDSPKARWVRRLRQEGLEPILLFVKDAVEEKTAFSYERKLIEAIGLKKLKEGPLLNRTKGGEGGKHFTEEDKAEYKKALNTRGKELALIGELHNLLSYTDHKCREHGVVRTAPKHVLGRIKRSAPLCPRCAEEKRGPQIRKHRLANGENSYRTLLASCKGYSLVGPYLGAVKLTTHRCRKHGEFHITPSNVRQKTEMGLLPCPSCNARTKSNSQREAIFELKRKQYEEALIECSKVFQRVGNYEGGTTYIEHWCSTHGSVQAKPSNVKAALNSGRFPCTKCAMDDRNSRNHLWAYLGGRKK